MTIFDGFLTNNNATLINFESIYDNDPYLQKFSEDKLKSLVKLFGKPITVLHNNDNVTFSQIIL